MANFQMYGAKKRYQDSNIAESYDTRFNTLPGKFGHWLSMRYLDRAIAKCGCTPTSTFLDLPCGTGRLTLHLAQKNFNVVAADISKEMMSVAQKKDYGGKVLKWVQADAEDLPFDDNEFDYVTSGRFLSHLPPEVRIKVLKEFSRVSKHKLIVGYHIRNAIADASRYIRTRGSVTAFNLSRVSMRQARHEFDAAGLREIGTLSILPVLHDYKYIILEPKNSKV